jgi:hypothetical protein
MKLIYTTCFAALILSRGYALELAATASDGTSIPAQLEGAFSILKRSYPKVDARKVPKAPANTVWLFRSTAGSTGTVEVAFQDSAVVYMVFRRGVGAAGWTSSEVTALHRAYSKELLNEKYVGETYTRFPTTDTRTHDLNRLRYGDGRIGNKGGASTPNNTAIIARKDFDISVLKASL